MVYIPQSSSVIPNIPIQEDSQATTVAATESQAQILFGAFHVGASNLGKTSWWAPHPCDMQVSEILWPTNLDFSPHEDPGMKLTEPLVTISLGSVIEPV